MSTGIVEAFDRSFGRIRDDETGDSLFVHWTDIETPQPNGYKILFPKNIVSYDVEKTRKGPQARKVRILRSN